MKIPGTSLGLFASLGLSALTGPAALGAQSKIVVTGELDPKFSLQIAPEELRAMEDQMKGLPKLEPQSIDINSLYDEADQAALGRAGTQFSKIFVNASSALVELKALVNKLAALSTLKQVKRYEGELFAAYQSRVQDVYNRLILSFGGLSPEVLSGMESCKSELCVLSIADAQRELYALSQKLNRGLNMDELSGLSFQFNFRSRLLRYTLEETLQELVPTNEPHGIWRVAVAAALTPFLTAARNANLFNLGEYLAKFLAAPEVMRTRLRAEPIALDYTAQESEIDLAVHRNIRRVLGLPPGGGAPIATDRSHLHILSCRMKEKGFFGHGHLGLGSQKAYLCSRSTDRTSDSGDRENQLELSLEVIGLGAGFVLPEGLMVTVVSPFSEIEVEGSYFGVSVSLGAIASFRGGSLWGKAGSYVQLLGLGAGLGVIPGATRITLSSANKDGQ